MTAAPMAYGVHKSNSGSINNPTHRRRHRPQGSLKFILDTLSGGHGSGNSEASLDSSNFNDQGKRSYNPASRDTGPSTRFQNTLSSRQSVFPNLRESTLSSTYNRPDPQKLTFQSSSNSTVLSNTSKPPTYYSQYDAISDNVGNDIDFPEYDEHNAILFTTDQKSSIPHFDVGFFPEELPPPVQDHDRTLASLPKLTYNRIPLTSWSIAPENTWSVPHSAQSTKSFSHSDSEVWSRGNITSFIFGQKEIHNGFDYPLSTVNFSSVSENGFNSSSSDEFPKSSDDFYTWSILMMTPLVIFGITGNTLVILAISLEKRLQNVTNYFLLSLSVTDLLVSLIVMPFSIINVFTGRWLFGLLLCDFFVTSDVLMCTSSILHLCTISLERYIGIRYPLWTKNKSKRIVLLKIVFVWTIALAITSPITVLGVIKEDNVLVDGICVLNNAHFIIYGSTFAFFIPLTIMVLMYVLTVRMLNKQARLCHSRRADDGEGQPIIRRSTSRRNWQSRRQYYGRETFNTVATYNGTRLLENDNPPGVMGPFYQRYRSTGVSRHNTIPLCHYRRDYPKRDSGGSSNGCAGGSNTSILNRRNNNAIGANGNSCNSDGSKLTSHNSNSLRRNRFSSQYGTGNSSYGGLEPTPEFPYCNGLREKVNSDLPSDSQNCCSSRLSSSSSSSSPTSSSNRDSTRLTELVRKHHLAVKAASVLLTKRDHKGQNQSHLLTPGSSSMHVNVRRDNSVRTEQKASKVLGVVFMIFVICWAPFFIVNILTAVCTTCRFESTLVTAFVWLGYVSSTLNPIIYTIFNNIFRITFIKLLCCRYRLLHRARRTSNLTGIRNGVLNYSDSSPAPHSATTTLNTTNSTFVEESNC